MSFYYDGQHTDTVCCPGASETIDGRCSSCGEHCSGEVADFAKERPKNFDPIRSPNKFVSENERYYKTHKNNSGFEGWYNENKSLAIRDMVKMYEEYLSDNY